MVLENKENSMGIDAQQNTRGTKLEGRKLGSHFGFARTGHVT